MAKAGTKKAPPEGGALVVEAGFIQARNLSSSGVIIRNRRRAGKSLLTHWPTSGIWGASWFRIAIFLLALAGGGFAGASRAEPAHGIAMHGAPALAPGFAHLPYADPAAVQGNRI